MQLSEDLVRYSNLSNWVPKVGDIINKDGVFVRWCAVVTAVSTGKDKVVIFKSGNINLLVRGEYKEETIITSKIKNAMVGTYYVVSDNVYFI
jgi:hypothetical protein